MIGDLKPYADYRDIGPALAEPGSIPAHWGPALRAKRRGVP